MRRTVGQEVVRFLAAQHSERDGIMHQLIEGCFDNFGHGNVAGLGEAPNAASLGATIIRADGVAELSAALAAAKAADGPVVIAVRTDPAVPAPDSGSWWDVPVAEVSELDSVTAARAAYESEIGRQRRYL